MYDVNRQNAPRGTDDDEDERARFERLSTGPTAPAGPAGSPAPTPTEPDRGAAGTGGFVNFDRYLAANRDATQKRADGLVADTGGAAAKRQVDGALGAWTTQVNAGTVKDPARAATWQDTGPGQKWSIEPANTAVTAAKPAQWSKPAPTTPGITAGAAPSPWAKIDAFTATPAPKPAVTATSATPGFATTPAATPRPAPNAAQVAETARARYTGPTGSIADRGDFADLLGATRTASENARALGTPAGVAALAQRQAPTNTQGGTAWDAALLGAQAGGQFRETAKQWGGLESYLDQAVRESGEAAVTGQQASNDVAGKYQAQVDAETKTKTDYAKKVAEAKAKNETLAAQYIGDGSDLGSLDDDAQIALAGMNNADAGLFLTLARLVQGGSLTPLQLDYLRGLNQAGNPAAAFWWERYTNPNKYGAKPYSTKPGEPSWGLFK